VRKISYKVENTRVGQVTDYDKLSMQIETNGAVTPEDSVALAARILQDQLQLSSISRSRAQPRRKAPSPSRRSTRTCCARWTSLSYRSVPRTA
jgi:DNA-directed RNA polymerase alpha subunit